jgi:hypothetical protein
MGQVLIAPAPVNPAEFWVVLFASMTNYPSGLFGFQPCVFHTMLTIGNAIPPFFPPNLVFLEATPEHSFDRISLYPYGAPALPGQGLIAICEAGDRSDPFFYCQIHFYLSH